MRITFGVVANRFGKMIWQIVWHYESLLVDCESLFKWIRQKTFFWYPPLFTQNVPPFRQNLCIECNNANKLRIMIRNSESLCQSVSQLRRDYQKMANLFSFLKTSPACMIHRYKRHRRKLPFYQFHT